MHKDQNLPLTHLQCTAENPILNLFFLIKYHIFSLEFKSYINLSIYP